MVHENITMASHGHDVLHQITTPNVCMTEDGAVVSGGIIHFLLIHPYSTYSFSIRTWSVARRRQLHPSSKKSKVPAKHISILSS
jgi:hypothetical protein